MADLRLLAAALLLLAGKAGAAPFVAAHRGNAGSGAGENTLAAYRAAIAAGADAVEADLRETADGQIVILHDATVDRTTTGHGRIDRMTLADAQALDAGGGERMPTLGQLFDTVRGTRVSVLLDLKRGGAITPAAVLAAARAHDVVDQVMIGTRTVADVAAFRAAMPKARIVALLPDLAGAAAFRAAGASAVRLWQKWIDADPGCRVGSAAGCVVTRLKAGGAVWAIPDVPASEGAARANFARLFALGLDGVLTDRADLAVAVRAGR